MESKLIFIFLVAYYPLVESSSNDNNVQILSDDEFVPTGNIRKYGCAFKDHNYNLGTDQALSGPSWGDTVSPLEIENDDDFQKLTDSITKINREVMSSYYYNSVDDLLEFFEDYKRANALRRGRNVFADFYNSYKPKFRPHENFLGFSIDVLDKISKELSGKWKNIKNNIFISSVQTDLSDDNFSLALKEKTCGSNYIAYVMATVKFTLQNRLGYILIDPGYNSFKEIIVMEDRKSPHNARQMDESVHGLTQYFIHQLNNNYIWSRHTNVDPLKKGNIAVKFLVYVGQAFCSFVDTTAKINLLEYYRVMAKRNSDGWNEGGFYFRALPGTKKSPKLYSEVTLYIHPKYKQQFSARIGLSVFEGTMSEVQKNVSTDDDIFGQVANMLNMTRENMVKKIQKFKDIFDAPNFLKETQLMNARIENPKKNASIGSFLRNLFGGVKK